MTPTEKEKLDKKSVKNTEELVKTMKILTKQFNAIGEKPKMDQTGKTGGLRGAVLGNLRGYARERFGIPTSGPDLLSNLSQRAGGGIMSTILSTASEHLREKEEEKGVKAKWMHGMAAGTDTGRALIKEHGIEKATKMLSERYEAKQRVESDISSIEQKRKVLKESGVEGADLNKEDLDRLEAKKKELAGIQGRTEKKESRPRPVAPVVTPPMSTEELSDAMMKRAGNEAAKTGMSPAEHAEFMGGVKQGIDEELLKLNEEQLAALKKLVAAANSEEDAFEKKKNTTDEKIEKKKEKTAENLKPAEKDGGSLIDNAIDLFKKKGPGRGLGRMAAQGARFLGAGAAVAGAGYMGYQAGSLLNEHVLQPGMEKITGVKGETVGTAAYSAVDKMRGIFGLETDADAAKRAEQASQMKYAKEKLAAGGKISADLASKVSAMGMSVPKESILVPGQVPYREDQTAALKDKTEAAAKVSEAAHATQAAPTIINNNSSNTSVMTVRPDVRIKEPSFNRALRMNYA